MSIEGKRVSAQEMAAEFKKLSSKEQERLYYMMQGVVLVSDLMQRQGTLHPVSDKKGVYT